MRVFVYEYCCAIGPGAEESDPARSLLGEGRAMRDAVAADFARIPGVEVTTLDGPLADEPASFRAAAASCDATLVIAPEFDDILASRCEWALAAGSRLLGPTRSATRLTSDKLELARHWRAAGVPTPETWPLDAVLERSWRPIVSKPRFGAGSTGTILLRRPDDLNAWVFDPAGPEIESVVQEYVPGRAASVSFLVSPSQMVSLPPAFQVLSADGRFRYQGGELPIRPDLAERAGALGRLAVDCLPGLAGYIGVDLVLGDAADGSRDVAIEINPRLTTSYVGLRQLADFNLAEVLLGTEIEPRWKPGRVRFRPDGTFDLDPTPGAVYG
jgi:predicted ATP-grasp superfamily ATP-dependent carboligase